MNKIEIIKKLRDETQLGMADCKSALEATNYDYDGAIKFLREKGKSTASKRSARATSNGFVGYKMKDNKCAIVEMCCETDFVSRGETFSLLMEEVLSETLSQIKSSDEHTIEAVKSFVKAKIEEAIGKTGENIEIKKVLVIPIQDKACIYVHNPSPVNSTLGQIVSMVSYASDIHESKLDDLKKLAMHIAATNPKFLKKENVSEDILKEEREIYTKQARESGKPEGIIPKMVEGKMSKFYEEAVLMEQSFVVDPDKKVSQFIKDLEKELGGTITIQNFACERLGS
jgi:elongation factor Ts